MSQAFIVTTVLLLTLGGCRRIPSPVAAVPAPTAFGVSIVIISGEKQAASVGASLDQPVVVQVTDAQGSGVAGALVLFNSSGSSGFNPPSGLTGSDGQFSTTVRLGSQAGSYSLIATTRDKSGTPHQITFPEVALDYQQNLGRQLSEKYCARCHDPESSAERVSNHDNLTVAAHAFSDGATLNRMTRANLVAIIARGGAALGKSAQMPPYSPTLAASEIEALVAYLRAVADPPDRLLSSTGSVP